MVKNKKKKVGRKKINKKYSKLSKEQIKEEIEIIGKGKYIEESIAIIGKNRGQLFVRIPKFVTKRLKLEIGQKFLFKIYNDEKSKPKLDLEVER